MLVSDVLGEKKKICWSCTFLIWSCFCEKIHAKFAFMRHTRNCIIAGIFLLSDSKALCPMHWHSRKKAAFQLLFPLGVMICKCFHGCPRLSALSGFQCCFLAVSVHVHSSTKVNPICHLSAIQRSPIHLHVAALHRGSAFVCWLLLFKLVRF